jgi:hypothetical protein
MNPFTNAIIHIQSHIGRRTDAHYREGYGCLFVPEGAPLTPHNVILTASEFELAVLEARL